MITCSKERAPKEEVFDLLVRSGLFGGVTLPLDAEKIGRAFDGSNLVITARNCDGLLVGVCRALSDFERYCFVATLAVAPEFKRRGIGRMLLAAAHEAAGGATKVVLLLHSTPEATGFYERIGMKREVNCFSLNNIS
jgi:ribosomal protein S18 acetylase RimI-like enzyme